jgi:hypothetical protein
MPILLRDTKATQATKATTTLATAEARVTDTEDIKTITITRIMATTTDLEGAAVEEDLPRNASPLRNPVHMSSS